MLLKSELSLSCNLDDVPVALSLELLDKVLLSEFAQSLEHQLPPDVSSFVIVDAAVAEDHEQVVQALLNEFKCLS